jgi:RNA-directed DNA polymerase
MRRLGGIWPQVMSFENLLLAYRRARRGQGPEPGRGPLRAGSGKGAAAPAARAAGRHLLARRYRLFRIYERKPRTIAAAPFRDRVVHHAVMNLERKGTPDSLGNG